MSSEVGMSPARHIHDHNLPPSRGGSESEISPGRLSTIWEILSRVGTAIANCFKRIFCCFFREKRIYIQPSVASRQFLELNKPGIDSDFKRVYILPNETLSYIVATHLAAEPKPSKPLHVGCGGWYNFTLAWNRQSDHVWIVDINETNQTFMNETARCVVEQETRQGFVAAILAYIKQNPDPYFHDDLQFPLLLQVVNLEDWINLELINRASWLGSDEGYAFIRELVRSGKFAAIQGDFTDAETFKRIRNIATSEDLGDDRLTPDTVYTSNIREILSRQNRLEEVGNAIGALSTRYLVEGYPDEHGKLRARSTSLRS